MYWLRRSRKTGESFSIIGLGRAPVRKFGPGQGRELVALVRVGKRLELAHRHGGHFILLEALDALDNQLFQEHLFLGVHVEFPGDRQKKKIRAENTVERRGRSEEHTSELQS